jgi:hypothetical protein
MRSVVAVLKGIVVQRAPFMNAWNTYREATTLATLHCCAMLAQDN